MEVNSAEVGKRAKTLEIDVTRRWIMNYAAGTQDPNPAYFNDEAPGGIIAPPMLSVGLTWPFSSRGDQLWENRSIPAEAGARGVHYSEVLQWHRPMRAGETLHIDAEVKAILPHRSGTHMITEFAATGADGEPVFTEYSGGLLRDVTCADAGKRQDAVPEIIRHDDTRPPLWQETIHIDPLAAHVYDACADIHNPIHTSVEVAHNVDLPGIILHGTATLALAVREITNIEAGADPRRIRAAQCNFTGMVLPGTDITVQVLGKEPVNGGTEVQFIVTNPDGKKALRNGSLTIAD